MSVIVNHPTPYPEVNALLQELLESMQTILGDHLIGVYLFGSLAGGDFDLESDVDVAVVTDEEVSGNLFSALEAMHAHIAGIDSPWATQLEVSYLPKTALRRYDPPHTLHPHIDRGRGERLHVVDHDQAWVVQRHTLRERGITLIGPAPHTLIDPVSPDDLRQAMLALLQGWAMRILADPARINSRGYQSYTVLSLCRMIYTLDHGTVVSKPAATRWAQETLGERWAALVERTWVGRQHPQLEATAEDIRGTLDFIRYTLERSRSVSSPNP
jgi:predicted nucleotidyltransferase